MEFETILYEVDRQAHQALITLNNPEKLNAISRPMMRDILDVCEEIQNDDDVWVAIWTGAGRGFCSGAQVGAGPRPAVDEDTLLNELIEEETWISRQGKALYGVDKPMIAAVNGVAAGAGYSLALCCDIRVGSENAAFVTVYSERNLPPEGGMSYMLPRIVGMGKAMDLLLTSRRIDAQEAYRIGLLERLVAPDMLLPEAFKIAERICEIPPGAVRITKRTVRKSMDADFSQATVFETLGGKLTRQTPKDAAESRAAFIEKRKPKFSGR